jgi:predicted HTH domain antitoxin
MRASISSEGLIEMNVATESTTIYNVLALARALSASERDRLLELLSRRQDEPLPEHASIDEAIGLYLAEACSLGRAAELAGVTRWDIIDRLKERGIPIIAAGDESAAEMDALAEELKREGIL